MSLVYLYGFVAPGTPIPPPSLLGVDGTAVEAIDLAGFRAAVSRVSPDAFVPELMEEHVRDLEWVGELGALHERVVTWFVDHGGIVPVRLLTLYSGIEALREATAPRAGALATEVRRLAGLGEWDLKLSYDQRALASRLGELSEAVATIDGEIEAAAPGRRYLLERKRARLVEEETARAARTLAGQLHGRLASAAQEGVTLPLPHEAGELPVVLNAAYLVALGDEARLTKAAEDERARLGPLGFDVRFTGPWAPYRFVRTADGADAPGQGGTDAPA